MGGPMGGLIKFPRKGMRLGDAEWKDRDITPIATRTDRAASLITWVDLKTLHDSDDNGDGGGQAA